MKKLKDIFDTLIMVVLILFFIGMTLIFPMVYDLMKAGELNLIGTIKYIGRVLFAIFIAGWIRSKLD